MPLFDGAIQFLGCRSERKRGSFNAMSTPAVRRDRSPHAIDKYCDLKTIWTAYS